LKRKATKKESKPIQDSNNEFISLTLKQMNGIMPRCNPSVLSLNEQGDIAFVSGHNIVIQNAEHYG
jgi:hypothetical protein